MTLHLFDNGEDIVSAVDTEDAWTVWLESMGERREDYDSDHFRWLQLPDGMPYTILQPDRDEGEPDCITKTCAEWAADGRRFAASRNY